MNVYNSMEDIVKIRGEITKNVDAIGNLPAILPAYYDNKEVGNVHAYKLKGRVILDVKLDKKMLREIFGEKKIGITSRGRVVEQKGNMVDRFKLIGVDLNINIKG